MVCKAGTGTVSWVGKVIGAIVGFALTRHPLGVLLGVMVGHLIDIGAFGLQRGTVAPHGFIEPLFNLIGAIAKSDGRVSEVEIVATERLIARMRLDAEQRRAAIACFTAGKQPGFAVNLAVADLKRWAAGRRDHAYILLDLLLDVVGVEGSPLPTKLAILRQLAWALNVHERELAALAAMKGYDLTGRQDRRTPPPRGQTASAPDPYTVLGITRDAGEREVKRAYRKLMSEHHPDKLGDVPEQLRRDAEDRAREINAAYERIKSARGFK